MMRVKQGLKIFTCLLFVGFLNTACAPRMLVDVQGEGFPMPSPITWTAKLQGDIPVNDPSAMELIVDELVPALATYGWQYMPLSDLDGLGADALDVIVRVTLLASDGVGEYARVAVPITPDDPEWGLYTHLQGKSNLSMRVGAPATKLQYVVNYKYSLTLEALPAKEIIKALSTPSLASSLAAPIFLWKISAQYTGESSDINEYLQGLILSSISQLGHNTKVSVQYKNGKVQGQE